MNVLVGGVRGCAKRWSHACRCAWDWACWGRRGRCVRCEISERVSTRVAARECGSTVRVYL